MLAPAAAVIACLSVLAACGSSSKPKANTNNDESAPENFASFGDWGNHESITNTLACGSSNKTQPMPYKVPYCFEGPSFGGRGSRAVGNQAYSLYELAAYGSNRPDKGGFKKTASWHCENGDHAGGLSTSNNPADWPKYPQSREQAKAALTACIDQFDYRLELAVWRAQGLLTNGGFSGNYKIKNGCDWPPTSEKGGQGPYSWQDKHGAKCEVLNQLGRAMHSAQDFFAHGNWADVACVPGARGCQFNVKPGELSVRNPAGLGYSPFPPSNNGRLPDFFRFTCSSVPTPRTPNVHSVDLGAVANCRPPSVTDLDNPHLVTNCNYDARPYKSKADPGCGDGTTGPGGAWDKLFVDPPPTITHYFLNKDVGSVYPQYTRNYQLCDAKPGAFVNTLASYRSFVTVAGIDNFQRSVTDACMLTRSIWSDFVAALRAVYPSQWQTMVNALIYDNGKSCGYNWNKTTPRWCPGL